VKVRILKAGLAAIATVVLAFLPVGAAHAYEWQGGSGISCAAGRKAGVQAYVYGDYNSYTNYGRINYYYAPNNYWSIWYVYDVSAYQSVSSVAVEAENYVQGPATAFCLVL
jgi:hypothetical protein